MRCSVPVESLSFIGAGHCLSLLSVLMCGVLLFEGASRTAAPLVPGPPRLQPENWWAPARELEGSITRTGRPCNSTPLNFDQSQRVPLDYNLVAALERSLQRSGDTGMLRCDHTDDLVPKTHSDPVTISKSRNCVKRCQFQTPTLGDSESSRSSRFQSRKRKQSGVPPAWCGRKLAMMVIIARHTDQPSVEACHFSWPARWAASCSENALTR